MEKIYSKVNTDKLLHVVVRKSDFIDGRIDVIDENHSYYYIL